MGNNATDSVTQVKLQLNGYQTLSIDVPLKAGDRIFCDGKTLWLCNSTWQKLKALPGSIPKLDSGINNIKVQSEFSGEQAPELVFDFKSVGNPEKIGK